MVHAIRIHKYGGPEELRFDAVDVGQPGAGQIRLKQTAIGLNFIDVYHRTGLYPIPTLPAAIGMEAAGVVEAVGSGVEGLKPGDRVAYGGGPLGAYAEGATDSVAWAPWCGFGSNLSPQDSRARRNAMLFPSRGWDSLRGPSRIATSAA